MQGAHQRSHYYYLPYLCPGSIHFHREVACGWDQDGRERPLALGILIGSRTCSFVRLGALAGFLLCSLLPRPNLTRGLATGRALVGAAFSTRLMNVADFVVGMLDDWLTGSVGDLHFGWTCGASYSFDFFVGCYRDCHC